jgi:hypothetical protein
MITAMPAYTQSPAANRGFPDEPAVGLAGWKIAALNLVILKERPLLPRMKDLNWRSPPLPLPYLNPEK